MSTFVNEHVNKLNSSLSSIFQNQACVRIEQTGAQSPEIALKQSDWNLFLALASQSIDLSQNSTLPQIDNVKHYLDLYLSQQLDDRNSTLEWLFIAKSVVAVYGQLLERVLNSTLPLSQSIQYWNGIYGSSLNEMYYAFQTIPSRAISLTMNTVGAMRETQLGLGHLLRSSEHVLASLFPLGNGSHPRTNPMGLTTRRTSPVFHVFSAKRPYIAQLIHEEVGYKKQMLERLRAHQATRLGLLMKMTPRFEAGKELDREICKCIKLMQCVTDHCETADQQQKIDVQGIIDVLQTSSLASTTDADVRSAAKELRGLIDRLDRYSVNLNTVHGRYQPPSALVRYWIPGLFMYVGGRMVANYAFNRKDEIQRWLWELGTTARDFAINWIWEPMLKVWDTIRLKDERLGVLGKEGLRSDLESLERMVIHFAQDHFHLTGAEAEQLAMKVREGDLSLVLKAYEQEIKSPVRNAIAGDLIRTLLIQVQKTKVDVDLALNALDKLLKSNELNFAFLAVAPSMLLSWGSISWLKTVYQSRTGQHVGKVGQPIRETMRRVQRLFDLSLVERQNHEDLKCESQGTLLCEVHLLRIYAQQLPRRRSIRDHFLEDLRDLEDTHLTVTQKLSVISRMSRTWDFLQPKSALKGEL
ncbi:ATP synthase regulation protein NCA2-domain-containing protein [Dichotomocladium elegans]|nr:ATP synthase regulation protein NCA2-domain-containing protein [Dichotomocladium elegans]